MQRFITLNFNGKIPAGMQELKYKLRQFLCGEFEFSIQEDVAGDEIYIYQTFSVGHFNDDIVMLQIVCDVLKRNNVKTINYFSPFLPYTRQDRTYNTTGSLGAKLVAEIVNNCGIDKITTYDFHAFQIEGFFKGDVNNLSAVPLFLDDIKSKFDEKNIVIVFPDAGACDRFKRFFEDTNYEIAIIDKTRTEKGLNMKMSGHVKDMIAIIIDDIIDSGETVIEASKLLKNNGSDDIFVYSTHGILSGSAVEKLQNDKEIKKITITNSLNPDIKLGNKFQIIKL